MSDKDEKSHMEISARIRTDKHISALWLFLRNSTNDEDIKLKDALEKHTAVKTILR